MPHLPRKTEVNVTKCHTCHTKCRGAPSDHANPTAPCCAALHSSAGRMDCKDLDILQWWKNATVEHEHKLLRERNVVCKSKSKSEWKITTTPCMILYGKSRIVALNHKRKLTRLLCIRLSTSFLTHKKVCKFYRWEWSHSVTLRQLPPRLMRVLLVYQNMENLF